MTRSLASRRAALWLSIPLVGLTGLWLAAPSARTWLLVNETNSLPRGLYLRQVGATPSLGDIVALQQPPAARPYLAGLGLPADLPLLKRVAAVAGQRACRRGAAFAVGGRTAMVLTVDRRGVALPAWRRCEVLADDEVAVLGDTATSFDSRYFGPVRRGDILGVYREVLSW